MALSDFFRGGRNRPHRDDPHWQDMRSRIESRNFGARQGSGYYGGSADAEGAWDPMQGDYQQDSFRDRPELRGSENEWRRSHRYGGQYGGGASFNDRWQNSYASGGDYDRAQTERSPGRSFGQSGNYGSNDEGPDRDEQRWWNEMYGREGSDMFGSRAGSFRGRGPRGYRRSDERIHEDVCEYLTDDERIDATNIQVAVKECEVTLSGSVSSREEKRRAEDLIERLPGVKDVHNGLRVVAEGRMIESSTGRDEQAGTSAASQPSRSSPSDETTSRH